jgi:hypothetical protein
LYSPKDDTMNGTIVSISPKRVGTGEAVAVVIKDIRLPELGADVNCSLQWLDADGNVIEAIRVVMSAWQAERWGEDDAYFVDTILANNEASRAP